MYGDYITRETILLQGSTFKKNQLPHFQQFVFFSKQSLWDFSENFAQIHLTGW